MKSALLAVMCLVLPALLQAQVYRHVDAAGNVTFSDQPREGAERIELDEMPTYQPRRTPERPRSAAPVETEPRYDAIRVLSPGDEEVVRDNQGRVTVRVGSEPGLADGHRYRLLLDGEAVASGRDSSFQLEDIHRGEYSLRVEIIRGDDQVIARSEPSTFYMLQASRLSPAR